MKKIIHSKIWFNNSNRDNFQFPWRISFSRCLDSDHSFLSLGYFVSSSSSSPCYKSVSKYSIHFLSLSIVRNDSCFLRANLIIFENIFEKNYSFENSMIETISNFPLFEEIIFPSFIRLAGFVPSRMHREKV